MLVNSLEEIGAQPRYLFGPGPSIVSEQVRQALALPTIGHLDPLFIKFMDQLQEQMRWLFQTKNQAVIAVSGPATAAMELMSFNLIETNDPVVVCVNGVFSLRMAEMFRRAGACVHSVDFAWGCPVDPDRLKQQLKNMKKVKAVFFVHGETSTGVLSPAQELCRIIKEYGALSIVDAVTSLGGVELCVDDWGIDAIYAGAQKCLSCPPGISLVSLSPQAISIIERRKSVPLSWFLDVGELSKYWGSMARRAYHHTAPVNMLYALSSSISVLQDEGIDAVIQRHKKAYNQLKKFVELNTFLDFMVDEPFRLPPLSTLRIADPKQDLMLRQKLLDTWGIEVGQGLGEWQGKVWRIGLMGESSREFNVNYLLEALAKVLP